MDLPPQDCHSELRKALLIENPCLREQRDTVCVNVAVDILYHGCTSKSLQSEMQVMTNGSTSDTTPGSQVLARPIYSGYRFCKNLIADLHPGSEEDPYDLQSDAPSYYSLSDGLAHAGVDVPPSDGQEHARLGLLRVDSAGEMESVDIVDQIPQFPNLPVFNHGADAGSMMEAGNEWFPSRFTRLTKVFPFVYYLLHTEMTCCFEAVTDKNQIATITDSVPLREGGSTEALGESITNSAYYYCSVCGRELGNTFLRCKGCSGYGGILVSAFQVCHRCYANERDKVTEDHLSHVQVRGAYGSKCKKRRCVFQEHDLSAHCLACNDANCVSCDCECHKVFEVRFRFVTKDDLDDLKENYDRVLSDRAQNGNGCTSGLTLQEAGGEPHCTHFFN